MDTTKVNKKHVLMVAHRGVSGLEPENSIPAFIAAGNRSYYGVETDVHVTADGQFIIIHDSRTGRVAEDDLNVEQSSYRLLRKIRLHNLCRKEIEAGLTSEDVVPREDLLLPSLEEYIRICKKYAKVCVLELKEAFAVSDIRRMIAEIKELGYLEQVIFISFDFDNMVHLRELLPNQQLQYLTSKYDGEVLGRLNQYNLDLDVHFAALTKEIVDEIHANGHKINCWTVDDKETAEKLVDWGVDYITYNILE
ncbi:MAG: hypothetical protein IJZ84_05210 [Lachnospiraceae bacterium]|nr:hypothetical protein [Lachnospiraceae bacterium]